MREKIKHNPNGGGRAVAALDFSLHVRREEERSRARLCFSLKAARERAANYRVILNQGRDPSGANGKFRVLYGYADSWYQQETLDARFDEFNLEEALWVIPATRTKSKREHRVPLSKQAVALIRKRAELQTSKYVFPARNNSHIADGMPRQVLRKHGTTATLHGFRSSEIGLATKPISGAKLRNGTPPDCRALDSNQSCP
jgi:integrase